MAIINHICGGGRIVVNGKTREIKGAKTVVINNGKITIDGVPVTDWDEYEQSVKDKQVIVNITINGNVEEINTTEADYIDTISVTGSCKKVRTHNGNVNVGGDCETVSTHNGNITCGNVGGDVDTHNGNISYRR